MEPPWSGLPAPHWNAPEWRCARVKTPREALLFANAERPDLALLDLCLPDQDGLELALLFKAVGLAIMDIRGRPLMIVSDKGTELTSMAILKWTQESGIESTISRRANRSRIVLSKASTVACAKNASTRSCSRRLDMHDRCRMPGATTTTMSSALRYRRADARHRRPACAARRPWPP